MKFAASDTKSRNALVALDMRTFGALVAHLRDRRVKTQKEVADAVGVDPNTIARAEQDKGMWYRRTSLAVFEYLGGLIKLTPEEALEYIEATGLSPDLIHDDRYVSSSTLRRHIAAEDAGQPVPNDPTSREMREVHRALSRVLEALGPAKATKLLDAVADAQNPAPARQPARELTVVDPPKVPFPGAVEQVHRTYEVRSAKVRSKANPKKRTG